MKHYYQNELDNLEIGTIRAIEEYTELFIPDWILHRLSREYINITDDIEKFNYLQELGDDMDLGEFNLTPIQEIIIAYMFVTNNFSKYYVGGVMELLDDVLV